MIVLYIRHQGETKRKIIH